MPVVSWVKRKISEKGFSSPLAEKSNDFFLWGVFFFESDTYYFGGE